MHWSGHLLVGMFYRAVRIGARAAALLLGVVWSPVADADQWVRPTVVEVFSEDRGYFVRVIPGAAIEHVVGFGARPGDQFGPDVRYARAEFYQRSVDGSSYMLTATTTLLNPIAPVAFVVANDGRLATIDNWHNAGYGVVVAIYTSSGEVVRSYRLQDLFSPAQIAEFPVSMSSVWWWEPPAYLRGDGGAIYLSARNGGELLVGLETGAFKYCETLQEIYRCRVSNSDREWVNGGDVPDPH